LFHPDRFSPPDIDPSQHRDVSRHDSHLEPKTLYTYSVDRDAS
jgi:hypothetical protein